MSARIPPRRLMRFAAFPFTAAVLGSWLATARPAEPEAPAPGGTATEEAAAPALPANPHGSFREDCSQCHRPEAWRPTHLPKDFDHGRFGFPLNGAHRSVPCLACHRTLEFEEVSGTRCADCHRDVHLGEMGMDCARCHSERDFIDRAEAVRTHRATRFPLNGAHLTTDCADCHRPSGGSAMRLTNLPVDCDGCHLADWQAAVEPNHVAQAFPTDCARCHSTFAWDGATFDHGITGFPLTGAHARTDCAQCHGSGPIAAVSTECVSCHRADYDGTTNPDHDVIGFSTDCASCHDTNGWLGARFDHDAVFFPIYSGRHQGEWTSCADCHTAAPSYTSFSCLGCHPHSDRAKTDGDHAGESGYAYLSSECYRCHPRGRP